MMSAEARLRAQHAHAIGAIEAIWRRGGVAQWLLRPLALLHAALVGLRRGLYRAGLLRREHLPVPVIVVGNRVAGGAGKTPVTIALVEALRAAGRRPGIVSRGHGRSDLAALHEVQPQDPAATCGDEPLLMRRRTGAPVVVGRDRAAAARQLLARHPDDLALARTSADVRAIRASGRIAILLALEHPRLRQGHAARRRPCRQVNRRE